VIERATDASSYYDWEFEIVCSRQAKDVSFWLAMAERFDGPILELCAGSGRITHPLARAGHRVTAIDSSAAMLERLRRGTPPDGRVRAVHADMRNFSLDERFGFAFVGYSSFQLLLGHEDQLRCLRGIHDHLRPGGVLGLDVCVTLCDGASYDRRHCFTAFYPPDRTVVSMYSACRIDKLAQIAHFDDAYEAIDCEGRRSVLESRIALKGLKPDVVELLLEHCGFRVIDVYGSFERGPVEESSEVLLYLAEKRP
jgi:SAM-dependent methyltransferase